MQYYGDITVLRWWELVLRLRPSSWWFYFMETMQHSFQWKRRLKPTSPRQKGARQVKSKVKSMVIIFLGVKKIVYKRWLQKICYDEHYRIHDVVSHAPHHKEGHALRVLKASGYCVGKQRGLEALQIFVETNFLHMLCWFPELSGFQNLFPACCIQLFTIWSNQWPQ